ncbi:transglutaminase domain-containing protein [Mycoplasmopsis alligatoris]|uniref:Transglutaminase-like domain-containing protein n=1 Tax=Mycoplasmopsis alligatoris A21JP2 TaxID=747682 RepID=D4XVR4_9BACT|nr:transglutaminase domain-containing protein [Mycoplasmopsis alligatoris]EFF41566.1 hypothetical protein MALL_0092 [Mycoplasmopsis alligatoris A21JP2]
MKNKSKFKLILINMAIMPLFVLSCSSKIDTTSTVDTTEKKDEEKVLNNTNKNDISSPKVDKTESEKDNTSSSTIDNSKVEKNDKVDNSSSNSNNKEIEKVDKIKPEDNPENNNSNSSNKPIEKEKIEESKPIVGENKNNELATSWETTLNSKFGSKSEFKNNVYLGENFRPNGSLYLSNPVSINSYRNVYEQAKYDYKNLTTEQTNAVKKMQEEALKDREWLFNSDLNNKANLISKNYHIVENAKKTGKRDELIKFAGWLILDWIITAQDVEHLDIEWLELTREEGFKILRFLRNDLSAFLPSLYESPSLGFEYTDGTTDRDNKPDMSISEMFANRVLGSNKDKNEDPSINKKIIKTFINTVFTSSEVSNPKLASYLETFNKFQRTISYGLDKDEVAKAYLVGQFVTGNFWYQAAATRKSPFSAIIDREAICDIYAKMSQIFLRSLNMEARIMAGVNGGTGHGSFAHAWNHVKINNKWLGFDTTLSDSHGNFNTLDAAINNLEDKNLFFTKEKQFQDGKGSIGGYGTYTELKSLTGAYENGNKDDYIELSSDRGFYSGGNIWEGVKNTPKFSNKFYFNNNYYLVRWDEDKDLPILVESNKSHGENLEYKNLFEFKEPIYIQGNVEPGANTLSVSQYNDKLVITYPTGIKYGYNNMFTKSDDKGKVLIYDLINKKVLHEETINMVPISHKVFLNPIDSEVYLGIIPSVASNGDIKAQIKRMERPVTKSIKINKDIIKPSDFVQGDRSKIDPTLLSLLISKTDTILGNTLVGLGYNKIENQDIYKQTTLDLDTAKKVLKSESVKDEKVLKYVYDNLEKSLQKLIDNIKVKKSKPIISSDISATKGSDGRLNLSISIENDPDNDFKIYWFEDDKIISEDQTSIKVRATGNEKYYAIVLSLNMGMYQSNYKDFIKDTYLKSRVISNDNESTWTNSNSTYKEPISRKVVSDLLRFTSDLQYDSTKKELSTTIHWYSGSRPSYKLYKDGHEIASGVITENKDNEYNKKLIFKDIKYTGEYTLVAYIEYKNIQIQSNPIVLKANKEK